MTNQLRLLGASPPEDDLMSETVEPRQYTYDDICGRFGVTKQTAFLWVRTGQIPSPTYYGCTARWTPEQWQLVCKGPQPKGTYPVADSPRANAKRSAMQAAIAAAVAAARAQWEFERLAEESEKAASVQATAKKLPAKKPTAKKLPAKKPTAKKGRGH